MEMMNLTLENILQYYISRQVTTNNTHFNLHAKIVGTKYFSPLVLQVLSSMFYRESNIPGLAVAGFLLPFLSWIFLAVQDYFLKMVN